MKNWLLRLVGFRWSYIEMPAGAVLNGPFRFEGWNIKLVGPGVTVIGVTYEETP